MSIDKRIDQLERVLTDLTFSVNELLAAVVTLRERLPLGPVAAEPEPEVESKTKPEAPKAKKEEPTPVNDPEPEVETKKIERADVSAACRALQQKDGNSDRAKKVLAQFGAKKVPDLTDAQLSDAYYAFEAAAAEEELA